MTSPIAAPAPTDAPNPSAAQLEDLEATFGLFNIRMADGAVVSARDTVAGLVQAPVLVALHGIGSGSASWLELARIFNLQRRFLAWDAPGYGESSPLAQAQPQATAYAQQLQRLLAALSIGDFVLVGHSLGALSAAAFTASMVPGLIPRALVLISPALGYGSAARVAEGQRVRAQRLASIEDPGIAAMAAARYSHLLSAQASGNAKAWVHWNMARLQPQGYRQATELLCGDDLLRYCRAIEAQRQRKGSPLYRLPVHIWTGSADAITTPSQCQQVADVFSEPLGLIEGAGHACYVEQPHAVAERLNQVLATLSSTTVNGV
ncbi:alpha/beta fold hydrolase [Lampropedia aestuarii]|uniref:alpha/beta fold hydrolase n=1 Tax=Lampropedia aestuarii TaxID=2562762 RepID=UPI0024684460|nr:alpha/beta hydrolase [Lampropedia aestuarii]MDH5857195.1 alpha/beta hydrolase [Lampropedia aestuarii]